MKLDRITAVSIAALVLLVGVVVPIFAHHSQAMFDLTKTVAIQGIVTEIDWSNPHVWFYLDAKKVDVENAHVENWSLEGQAPNFLMSNGEGWQPDTIKVGDKITAIGNQRKDGKPTMLLLGVTLADGKKFTSKSPFK
jgi:Family of unknown function (DUF6152)